MIGCLPNSADYNHPQDRRRYIPYFKEKKIEYETAHFDKDYDVLYVSLSADLTLWSQYKQKQLSKGKKVRVIFDLSDFYLSSDTFSDVLRPIFHYLSGRNSSLGFSYKRTLLQMIESTDVLICASHEQKKELIQYHSNVVIVRDYFQDDIKSVKTNYNNVTKGEVNVLWEGLSHGNKIHFQMLRDILETVNNIRVRLHVITDPVYCRFGGKYLCKPTYSVLKNLFKDSNMSFHLYDWNTVTFSNIASACDLALIPVSDDPVMRRKPENKLLLFLSMGIPVIASDTDSYKRVMNDINQNYVCSNIEDWQDRLSLLANNPGLRLKYIESTKEYLSNICSLQAILSTNERIFFGSEL